LKRLDEFVEGELEGTSLLEVETHLAGCADCAARHEGLRREQRLFADYLLDVEATPQLWRGLQASIEQRQAARRAQPLTRFHDWLARGAWGAPSLWQRRYASGLVALAIVSVAIALLSVVATRPPASDALTGDDSQNSTASATKPREDAPGSATVAALEANNAPVISKARSGHTHAVDNDARPSPTFAARRIMSSRRETISKDRLLPGERSYLEAIARLSALIEKSTDRSLHPRLRSEYERNLATVDQAIAMTRSAARSHADDPQMAQFVLAAYHGKLELLTTMVERSQVVTTEF
jgi:anti-sigma factor RsiW